MTPKFYYDCPIKAAYMAKYFGITFLNQTNNPVGIHKILHLAPNSQGLKIYVHPDNNGIFEPENGDIGAEWIKEAEQSFPAKYDGGYWMDDECMEKVGNFKIIIRDNKHFFIPEVVG